MLSLRPRCTSAERQTLASPVSASRTWLGSQELKEPGLELWRNMPLWIVLCILRNDNSIFSSLLTTSRTLFITPFGQLPHTPVLGQSLMYLHIFI